MKHTDYLIIGAGIVGCTAAYFLTKEGKKVLVVDRSFPCNEASGVNAGGLLQYPTLPSLLFSSPASPAPSHLQTLPVHLL